jgi:hypothetical protein
MEVRKSMYNWGLCTFIISFTGFNESPFNPMLWVLAGLTAKNEAKMKPSNTS